MTAIRTLVIGAALALSAGAACAQMGSGSTSGSMSGGSMSGGTMSGSQPDSSMSSGSTEGSMSSSSMSTSATVHMSAMDQKTLSSCQDMDRDTMMAAAKCKRLKAKHPALFNSDGSLKGGNSTPH